MKKKSKQSAFTLIEILFIIVIIGIVLTLSLTAFQQRGFNTKIDKTALQMQQIFQAANTYYAAWGCWPKSANCPNNAEDFNLYLPIGNQTNPWGNPYSYFQDPNNPSNFLIYSGNLINNQAANRIASVLPNANVDTKNNKQVILSTQGENSGILIQYLITQILNNSSTFQLSFECPKNWVGSAVAVPYGIETPDQDCFWYPMVPPFYQTITVGSNLISNLQPVITSCNKTAGPDEDSYVCSGMLNFTSNIQQPSLCQPEPGDGGTATVMVIGYCTAPSNVGTNQARSGT